MATALPQISNQGVNPFNPFNDPNPFVTLNANIGDGSLLVITAQGTFANDITSVTIDDDVAGAPNTYQVLEHAYEPTLGEIVIVAICNNCKGLVSGKSIKLHLSSPQIHMSISVDIFFPIGNWKFRGINHSINTASGTTISSGSITTVADQCLIYGMLAAHGGPPGNDVAPGTITAGAGFALGIGGVNATHNTEYMIQATAGPVAATFGCPAGTQVICYVLAFEPYGFVAPSQTNFNPNEIVNPGASLTIPLAKGAIGKGHAAFVSVGWSVNTPGTITVTDNAAGVTNSYTVVDPGIATGSERFGFAFCSNVQGNPTTITVAVAGIGVSNAIIGHVDEYAGSWKYTGQHGNGVSSTTSIATSPALTPGKNNALLYTTSWVNAANGAVNSGSPNFTLRSNQLVIAGLDLIQPVAGSVAPSVGANTTGQMAAITALFEQDTHRNRMLRSVG